MESHARYVEAKVVHVQPPIGDSNVTYVQFRVSLGWKKEKREFGLHFPWRIGLKMDEKCRLEALPRGMIQDVSGISSEQLEDSPYALSAVRGKERTYNCLEQDYTIVLPSFLERFLK